MAPPITSVLLALRLLAMVCASTPRSSKDSDSVRCGGLRSAFMLPGMKPCSLRRGGVCVGGGGARLLRVGVGQEPSFGGGAKRAAGGARAVVELRAAEAPQANLRQNRRATCLTLHRLSCSVCHRLEWDGDGE